jgi:putative oxygen-independent coproporphyrinogen III oxidase
MTFGIYVHYPYCTRRCPYCDFNVAVVPTIPHRAYRDAVVSELGARAPAFAGRPAPVSVYFGGGTPGLWPAEHIGGVIEAVAGRLGLTHDAEITVECNPEDVTVAGLRALREVGVNRVSLGIQSFDAAVLEGLGRAHGAAQNREAVDAAHRAGFERFSVDLIHGLAGQTVDSALVDVDLACTLGAPHISTYQLTIEPQTAFGRRARRGEVMLVDEDRLLALFEAVRARLRSGGVEPYEVSNAARPGFEAVHNSLYWTGGEYLALGAGAHGFRREGPGGTRWENERNAEWYMRAALAGHPAERVRETIDAGTWLEEKLLTGLRLDRGVTLAPELRRRFGTAARHRIAAGFLEEVDGRWRMTDKGRPVLDRVVLDLVTG